MPDFDTGVKSELLFRAVNERIFEIAANEEAALEILCESEDKSCISTVAITIRDYERDNGLVVDGRIDDRLLSTMGIG